jgi:AbrB family looped-hinge helix DNA binding protein
MAKTRLSSEGQVIIPKAVRERQGWEPGTELEVEDQGDVVVLRRARLCLKYDGPPRTVEEMDEGIAEAVRQMWEEFEQQNS